MTRIYVLIDLQNTPVSQMWAEATPTIKHEDQTWLELTEVYPASGKDTPDLGLVDVAIDLVAGTLTRTYAVVAPVAVPVVDAKVMALETVIVAATQDRLDTFARTRNYDSILSACTYSASSIPQFKAEGDYAILARDETWAALYSLVAAVLSGSKPVPTGFTDIEGELPVLIWPNLS